MATLTVTQFDSPDGAERVLSTLKHLQDEALIAIDDAAIVSWPADAKEPRTTQLHNLAVSGTLGGAFWGMLFGLVFTVPVIGLAVGAASGAVAGVLSDSGIDDDFVEETRKRVTPGTSALFLLTSDAVRERVADALRGELSHATLLHTSLSADQERTLRDTFGVAAEAPADS
jgi:uncharacterized membrane protein